MDIMVTNKSLFINVTALYIKISSSSGYINYYYVMMYKSLSFRFAQITLLKILDAHRSGVCKEWPRDIDGIYRRDHRFLLGSSNRRSRILVLQEKFAFRCSFLRAWCYLVRLVQVAQVASRLYSENDMSKYFIRNSTAILTAPSAENDLFCFFNYRNKMHDYVYHAQLVL